MSLKRETHDCKKATITIVIGRAIVVITRFLVAQLGKLIKLAALKVCHYTTKRFASVNLGRLVARSPAAFFVFEAAKEERAKQKTLYGHRRASFIECPP